MEPAAPTRTEFQATAFYRIPLGILTLIAIAYQFASNDDRDGFTTLNFFSFFTIQSNLLAALIFLAVALYAPAGRALWLDLLRGAAVVYMTTTGVVYALLLADVTEDLQTTIPWVNVVVHQLMPIAVVVDWLIDPPRNRIRVKDSMTWLAFPIIWLIYTMIRGSIVDWYPYPFLDADEAGGALEVVVAILGIAVGMILLSLFVGWVGNELARRGGLGASFRSRA